MPIHRIYVRGLVAPVVLLVACVLLLAACGGGSDIAKDATIGEQAKTRTTKPKQGPAPVRVEELPAPAAAGADEEDLLEAATRWAKEHPDQVGDDTVSGPLDESVHAAVWGPYEYAIGSFETGSELDESVYFYRDRAAEAQWKAVRWVEAGDISSVCLLPQPLAKLWFPDIATSPACAAALPEIDTSDEGWRARVRTFDGLVTCQANASVEGPELACWRRELDSVSGDSVSYGYFPLAFEPVIREQVVPDDSAADQLETATIGWGTVQLGPYGCTSTPSAFTCSARDQLLDLPFSDE